MSLIIYSDRNSFIVWQSFWWFVSIALGE